MTLTQKEKSTRTPKTDSRQCAKQPVADAGTTGRDEQAWDSAIANSLDAIRELAERARAERQTGRTKKITL